MRLLIVLIAAVFATACSPRIYPVQRDTVTQVRTEIVERPVRDTVEVALPQDSTSVRTADTTSTLAIRAATSTATVSGGVLTHALYSNPNYKPEVEVVYKDRVEYRDTTIYASNTEVIEVERELSVWQRALMGGGYVLLGMAVLLIVLWILKSPFSYVIIKSPGQMSGAVSSDSCQTNQNETFISSLPSLCRAFSILSTWAFLGFDTPCM